MRSLQDRVYESQFQKDMHSRAEPDKFRVRHLDLELEALFDARVLRGSAILTIQRMSHSASPLVLDTRDLIIKNVEISDDSTRWAVTNYYLGSSDIVLGAPLFIEFPSGKSKVKISFCTSHGASGLQWLDPVQTSDKKFPFLFSQSQEIHARSWVPLQDTPSVRFTFNARVKTPKDLFALMGATKAQGTPRSGIYEFQMDHPIPSYLLALAIGDIAFAATGPRTGVYAERSILSAAVNEFSDTERMLLAAEGLYGAYRWDRYDLLILPPSFPFGGMENPKVTFISPTLITGDKGLVALVAHELAHSWAGNLVTNATWSDFWLNEGFTTYIERRIVEAVYGESVARMEDVLGRQKLDDDLAKLTVRDQVLCIDLEGRDPDDGSTEVPYEKGYLFLKRLEEVFGRAELDRYLRNYFDSFAFQSITTNRAIEFLKQNLLSKHSHLAAAIDLEEWIYKPGIPASAPITLSERLAHVKQEAQRWSGREIAAAQISASGWTTHEWRCFLGFLPLDIQKDRMHEIDYAFHLTESRNVEIVERWLRMAARNGYEAAFPRIEEFLLTVGRKKYIKPLYEELIKIPENRRWAEAIYAKARPGYHPIARAVIDKIVRSD